MASRSIPVARRRLQLVPTLVLLLLALRSARHIPTFLLSAIPTIAMLLPPSDAPRPLPVRAINRRRTLDLAIALPPHSAERRVGRHHPGDVGCRVRGLNHKFAEFHRARCSTTLTGVGDDDVDRAQLLS